MFLNIRKYIAFILFTIPLSVHAYELLAAVWSGDIQTVESLLTAGANVNETDKRGWTPLMYAAFRGEHDIAIKLLKSGANVNADDTETKSRDLDGIGINSGATPLMIAALRENADIVNLLLGSGADINIADSKDDTALSLAIATGNSNIISQLLKKDPIVSDVRGERAIGEAVVHGNEVVVKELLDRGVDANTIVNQDVSRSAFAGLNCSYSGDSLLTCAIKSFWYAPSPKDTSSQFHQDYEKILLHLLKNKADPNFNNKESETALLIATTSDNTSAMKLLLENGADPNIQGGAFGNTALMSTTTFCQLNHMKLLIAYGADPNIQNKNGHTAISEAQRQGCKNIVTYLEELDARYPLSKNIFEAAKFGNLSKVQQFIREGGDVNSIDEDGIPILNWAIESNRIDVIEELLKAGANANTPDLEGNIPLMGAITGQNIELVKLLINYGADVNAHGGAPASYAKYIGAIEIIEVLEKAGAKYMDNDQ